jgi:hypothetical protein
MVNKIQPYDFHLKGSADENTYAVVLGEPNQGSKSVLIFSAFNNLGGANMNNVTLTINGLPIFFTLEPTQDQLGNAGSFDNDSWLERVGLQLFAGSGNTFAKRKRYWLDVLVDYLTQTPIGLDYNISIDYKYTDSIRIESRRNSANLNLTYSTNGDSTNFFLLKENIAGFNDFSLQEDENAYIGCEVWTDDIRSKPFNSYALEYAFNGTTSETQRRFNSRLFIDLQKSLTQDFKYYFDLKGIFEGTIRTSIPVFNIESNEDDIDTNTKEFRVIQDRSAITNYTIRPYVIQNISSNGIKTKRKTYLYPSIEQGRDFNGDLITVTPDYKYFLLNTLKETNLYPYWRQFYFKNNEPFIQEPIRSKAVITFTYPIIPETTSFEFTTTNTGFHKIDNTAPYVGVFEDVTDLLERITKLCADITADSGGYLQANVIASRGYSEVDIEIYETQLDDTYITDVVCTNSAALVSVNPYSIKGLVKNQDGIEYDWVDKEGGVLFLSKKPRQSFLQVRSDKNHFYKNDQDGTYHSYTTLSILMKNLTSEISFFSYYKLKVVATKLDNSKVERYLGLVDTSDSLKDSLVFTYPEAFDEVALFPLLDNKNGLYHFTTYYKHYFPNLGTDIKEISFQMIVEIIRDLTTYSAPYSEVLTYKVVAPNIVNTKVIRFLNSIGGWDEVLCDRTIKVEIDSNVSLFRSSSPVYKNTLESYAVKPINENLNGELTVGEINTNETFTCRIVVNDREEWVYLKELLTSPTVLEQNSLNEYRYVSIIKSNWIDSVEESNQIFEFSYKYLQTNSVKVNV